MAFGAVVFGVMVQLTHRLLLTALQATLDTPVAGQPVDGHCAPVSGGTPEGFISSLYWSGEKELASAQSYSYTYPAAWEMPEDSLLVVINNAGKETIARQPLNSMASSSVLASSEGFQYSPQFTADHKWLQHKETKPFFAL